MNTQNQILVTSPQTGHEVDVLPFITFLEKSLLRYEPEIMEDLMDYFSINISSEITDVQDFKLNLTFLHEIKQMLKQTKKFQIV